MAKECCSFPGLTNTLIRVLLEVQDDVLHGDYDSLLQQNTVVQRNVLEECLQVDHQVYKAHLHLDHLILVHSGLPQLLHGLAQFDDFPDDPLVKDAARTGARNGEREQIGLCGEQGELPVLVLVKVKQRQMDDCVDKGQIVILGYLLAEHIPALTLCRAGLEAGVDL